MSATDEFVQLGKTQFEPKFRAAGFCISPQKIENIIVINEINIRRANAADAAILAELSYQTFHDAFHAHPKNAPADMADYMEKAFSVEQTMRELAEANSIFLIAEIENAPAGYVKLKLGSREEPVKAEKPIELCRLYSHQKYLGKGVGAKLMAESLKIAAANDCDVMWLGVWEFNPRAQRFYEKYDFREIGKHIFQLGSDAQIDLLMEKKLKS